MALQKAGHNALSLMVTTLVEVTHGNLSGRKVTPNSSGSPYGRLDFSYRASFAQAEYAIYSYGTPIAWLADGEWYMPNTRYTVTTTNHQNAIRMALHYAGKLVHTPVTVDPRPTPTA